MGITLPFETGLNKYVTNELAFEFHYFFTRKFWMVYHCQALIVAPGGYGTLDEIFEVLTLKQTRKIQTDLPVVLFGKEFWKKIVNWEVWKTTVHTLT
jgi:predicted Rossmann-fold nucleotide-binding protein